MTLTRSQTGKTPKKVQPDGFVETPSRRITRSRASKSPEYNEAELSSSQMIDSGKPRKRREVEKPVEDVQAETRSNGAACPAATTEAKAEQVVEHTDHFEFGGSWGVLSMMIGFPLLMYYMWIGRRVLRRASPSAG
ncbi:hypothetical protein CISG_02427 [Coccidioides immitis RMSCC 3703]|uniref:Uncharacterized protein n=1 Tax=Coccidioides immitis RMSCC 3703 TaxID=454286 RepID=A0A0J8RAX7_COCIT|nr:hypothetical protein CISG_02427 [Coccidioides immitis RMSCC 3703]